MPDHLVRRINASLAAEQAQRAGKVVHTVSPLLTSTRHRRGRLLWVTAGAAAAVGLVTVVGPNMFKAGQPTTTAARSAIASTSATPEVSRETQASAKDAARAGAAAPFAPSSAAPFVQIRLSETRYTQADFVTQASTLRDVAAPAAPAAAQPPADGVTTGEAVGTPAGLTDCLGAIGAGGAQLVRADVAYYEGQPAVIIVATTNGQQMAFAVTRQCSRTEAAVLRPATPLP